MDRKKRIEEVERRNAATRKENPSHSLLTDEELQECLRLLAVDEFFQKNGRTPTEEELAELMKSKQ